MESGHQSEKLPSRELTYPPDKAYLKMIFLFPRWDMLVSWRVILFDPSSSPVYLMSICPPQEFPKYFFHFPLMKRSNVTCPNLGLRDYPTAAVFPILGNPKNLGCLLDGFQKNGDKTMGWIEIAFCFVAFARFPAPKKNEYCSLLSLPPVAKRPQTGVGIWNA